jgi:hypothetical protein
MKYHHIGVPTTSEMPGETYLPDYRFHCTDHESNPFGIQWMRYDKDCPLPEVVKSLPHIAFEVDDLEESIEGHEVIIEPNSPSKGVMVAFVLIEGLPVEFLQFTE